MEFKIIDIRTFTDKSTSKEYRNYKFFFKGKGFWISEKLFEQFPDLLKIKDDKIVLKEPLEEFYGVIINKNEKGEFKTIHPKAYISIATLTVFEPEVAYKTNKKEIIKDRKENKFIELSETIDKQESQSKVNPPQEQKKVTPPVPQKEPTKKIETTVDKIAVILRELQNSNMEFYNKLVQAALELRELTKDENSINSEIQKSIDNNTLASTLSKATKDEKLREAILKAVLPINSTTKIGVLNSISNTIIEADRSLEQPILQKAPTKKEEPVKTPKKRILPPAYGGETIYDGQRIEKAAAILKEMKSSDEQLYKELLDSAEKLRDITENAPVPETPEIKELVNNHPIVISISKEKKEKKGFLYELSMILTGLKVKVKAEAINNFSNMVLEAAALLKNTYKQRLPLNKISRQSFISGIIPHLKKTKDDKLKDKFFNLITKEIEKYPDMEDKIMRELGEIKERIGGKIEKNTKEETKKSEEKKELESKQNKIFSHNPTATVEFLKLFENELKFFTHKWIGDEPFNRKEEIKKADEIIKKYKNKIPSRLWDRVKVFLTKNMRQNKKEDEAEWFVNHIFGETKKSFYSWDNDKFIKWFENSVSKDITAPEIDNEMIQPFKNSIQIRDGNFERHIKPIANSILNTEFNISYLKLEQAKFFIDVQLLMIGVKKILNSIKEIASKNGRFNIIFEYLDEKRCLKICHEKSVCELNSTNKDLFGGSFNDIKNDFTNLCDWSIEAMFADGAKRINILKTSDEVNEIEELNYQPEGFTHKLYFY